MAQRARTKSKRRRTSTTKSVNGDAQLALLERQFQRELVENAVAMRTDLLRLMTDQHRDIDAECGYPKHLTPEDYRQLYDRWGYAQRVVNLYPRECWSDDPEVYETEDDELTPFEEAWNALGRNLLGESWYEDQKGNVVYHWLQRADELSGIGRFGVIFLGLDDGRPLDQPVAGVSEDGRPQNGNGKSATKKNPRKLLFLRVFDESLVRIKTYENDLASPRHGQPKMYSIAFAVDGQHTDWTDVHWSRVIHIADNRESNEVLGVPRMQFVFNFLLDLRKLHGGAPEMFWKGAFPGYSFEVNPDLDDVDIDTEALREEFYRYSEGLQRYLALQGVSAKSLSPQISDPTAHIEAELKALCIALDIPYRIFAGSERGELASTQDSVAWNKRITRRRNKYVSPMILRPFVDRLILVGVLPEPKQYFIHWPDLHSPSNEEKASIATKIVETIAKYLQAGADALLPPEFLLTRVLWYSEEEAHAILKAAEQRLKEEEEEAAAAQAEQAAQALPPGVPASPPPLTEEALLGDLALGSENEEEPEDTDEEEEPVGNEQGTALARFQELLRDARLQPYAAGCRSLVENAKLALRLQEHPGPVVLDAVADVVGAERLERLREQFGTDLLVQELLSEDSELLEHLVRNITKEQAQARRDATAQRRAKNRKRLQEKTKAAQAKKAGGKRDEFKRDEDGKFSSTSGGGGGGGPAAPSAADSPASAPAGVAGADAQAMQQAMADAQAMQQAMADVQDLMQAAAALQGSDPKAAQEILQQAMETASETVARAKAAALSGDPKAIREEIDRAVDLLDKFKLLDKAETQDKAKQFETQAIAAVQTAKAAMEQGGLTEDTAQHVLKTVLGDKMKILQSAAAAQGMKKLTAFLSRADKKEPIHNLADLEVLLNGMPPDDEDYPSADEDWEEDEFDEQEEENHSDLALLSREEQDEILLGLLTLEEDVTVGDRYFSVADRRWHSRN